ncbi:hypothetical protein LUZ61_010317 [Rhynchospora tenuis]|uniref:DAGKc domain-containing protein n=1 Tax=Rhynchospora tenuis TaxID=198213 RepID=A0AAD5ZYZ0_9POAL|nr:hypothetical protein LUZ61_010317 [Rhynchospora tenuis]
MEASDENQPTVSTTPQTSSQKSSRRSSGRRSQKSSGQHSSPTVFPEKRSKSKPAKHKNSEAARSVKEKTHEHRIDIIGDEKSDLLGYEVLAGQLVLDRKNKSVDDNAESGVGKTNSVNAKLTSKALLWGSKNVLSLEDVVSVTYSNGLRHFTVHAYPSKKKSFALCCFNRKSERIQKDFRFLATTSDEAVQWVSGFAEQHCFVNLQPHPLVSSKKQPSDFVINESIFDQPAIKRRSTPRILVILNPRSGHGRSSKVFHNKIEPMFKLAGFMMEVVKTSYAGHAKSLAATVDFSTCPDGIVCVGGDGIVNEVLNGLLSRSDQKEAVSVPIGIIPAGSDNSLVWTVLGVRDPISAAMSIIKGGLTAADVFSVKWIQTGVVHYGTTVSYFGFLSDVLELSEKYQKRFGPLRYFVAGFLKFLCLPKYSFELEYLPMTKDALSESQQRMSSPEERRRADMSELYDDILRRSRKEGLPRASSLSSIDSMMSPSRTPVDGSNGSAVNEPSEVVRALDPKSKRLSVGRSNNIVSEPEEVLHPQPFSSNPNWPRTRSKSRTDKASTASGLTTTESRSSWAATSAYDREDISSTVSDPGPAWDTEPKWDAEPRWDTEPTWEERENESTIELPDPSPDDLEAGGGMGMLVPNMDEKWVVRKGKYLGVLVCNHSCRTVQSLSSQVVAPKAEFDDRALDLLLVGGTGRWRLLRFFILLQFGRHLSLPYVEYVKVKSVKLKPGSKTQNGCGIDGELLKVKGQVLCSMLPEQYRLIGYPSKHRL